MDEAELSRDWMERVEAARRHARNAALEEAAKAADERGTDHRDYARLLREEGLDDLARRFSDRSVEDGHLAHAIRTLKGE